jgi:hypothetical protein
MPTGLSIYNNLKNIVKDHKDSNESDIFIDSIKSILVNIAKV